MPAILHLNLHREYFAPICRNETKRIEQLIKEAAAK